MDDSFRMMRVALAVLLMVGSAHSAQRWLTDKDIVYVFGGRDLAGTYRNGVAFSETYRLNGKIEYKDSQSSFFGNWSVKSGAFCTTYDNGDGGCFRVTMQGQNCYEYWLIDPKSGTVAALPIARSSNVKYASTCQK